MRITLIALDLQLLEPGGVSREHLPGLQAGETPPSAPLDVDSQGRPFLPPTSLIGAMRALVREERDEATTRRWFGHVDSDSRVASPISIWNTELVSIGGGGETVTRTRSAIDVWRGAAANRRLVTVELAPAGTRWRAYLGWHDADAADLEWLLAVLASWRPLIGRGTSAGHGRCAVVRLQRRTLDLGLRADLMIYLRNSGPALFAAAGCSNVELCDPGSTDLFFLAELSVASALHIGSGRTMPLGESREMSAVMLESGMPVVPGPGLKGMFRSRVGYILRSVGLDDHACTTGSCLRDNACFLCRVFGSGGASPPGRGDAVGQRGRARVRGSVIENAVMGSRTHAPIDRFTGGVGHHTGRPEGAPEWVPKLRHGLLHTNQVVESGSFQIRVEDDGIAEQDGVLLRALLVLALRDIHDGFVRIGGNGTRGYGRVRVSEPDASEIAKAQATLTAVRDAVRRTESVT